MVNNHNILYSDNVKYLGVYFDSSLSFHRHISNLLRSINFHLHSFRLIRNSISLSVSITLASSFILPLFDYCNILLFFLPGYQIKKLQILQNALVRSIFKIDRFSQIHISPYLHRLHWLPIKFRIIFKVLLLTHNSLHHNRPEYLSSLISIPTHTISLRSTTSYLLHLPYKLNLHTTNIRAWHISAPYLWNKLPHNLRSTQSTTSFKSLLKHIYLLLHFPDIFYHYFLSISTILFTIYINVEYFLYSNLYYY